MADNVTHGFKFAPAKDWTPYSGEGGSDAFPFDGIFAVKIGASSTFTAKRNDRGETPPMIKIHAVSVDEDAKGLRIISNLHLDGTDRNGGWMGRQFVEFMHSAGTTQENINKMAESGTEVPDANVIVKKYADEGKIAYVEVEADVYDGKDTSRVRNWVTKERYEQAKALGAHRRPRRTIGQAPLGAGAGAGVGNLGGAPQGAVNGTSANAAPLPML